MVGFTEIDASPLALVKTAPLEVPNVTPPVAVNVTIAPLMALPLASVTVSLALTPELLTVIVVLPLTSIKEIALILIADVGVEPALSVVPPPFTGGGNVSLPPPPPQPARASAVVNAES